MMPLGALFLLVGGVGCAEAVREYGSGGSGGDPGSTSSSSGGVGGAGGAGGGVGGSGGAGGAPALVCMPGQPAYAGPLCGPPGMPCKLLADENVQSPPAFRNDAPAVTADLNCEPQLAFSVAENGFHGFHARRDDAGQFVVDETPFEFASGGIAVGADGVTYVLAYAGAFNAAMFRRGPAGWDAGVPLPGSNFAFARGFARDAGGILHVGSSNKENSAIHAIFDPAASTFAVALLAPVGTPQVALGLGPDGAPHLAYWSAVNGMWVLNWNSPPQIPEEAVPLNGGSLDIGSQMHSIAVTPDPMEPSGAPHILVLRNTAVSEAQELVHATRYAGQWSYMAIDQEKIVGASHCNLGPKQAGETCDYDYEEIIPIGIVASQGGDSIAVYNKVHRMGTLVSDCMDPNFCFWQPLADNSTGQIVTATFNGEALVAQGSVGANAIIQSGTAAIDTIGRVHIALYDRPPGQNGSTARYLLVGP